MLPTLWGQFGDGPFLFQHDRTPVHRASSIKTWMSESGVEELDWPAQIPDLHPIEHLWDGLERRLRARPSHPTSVSDLTHKRFLSPCQAPGDPEMSEGSMTDEGVYKAEIVYVTESEDTEPRETGQDPPVQLKSTDSSALSPSPTPAMAHMEMSSPCPRPLIVEPSDNRQSDISRQSCRNTFDGAEVSSDQFLNVESQREEEVLSPASSVDLFPSMASSKESIVSEGWEHDRSWSALQMLSPSDSPLPFSGTVSPCSSVRSGAFTPSVLRIKRHTLVPASSLAQMPISSGQTLCCDSRTSSPCPLSSRARHRPPPTQLSLLTAILRKGRLPILSPALQRPYSSCWPISPVSMSSCKACSAASTVAPMEPAKACASKGKWCTDPSHNARPTSPRLTYNTPSRSLKEHSKSTISSAPDSSALPVDSSSLTMPSYCPTEHAPGHLSKPVYKDNHVPRVPSSLLFSSFSSSRSLSPKSSHLSCCRSESQPTSGSCANSATPVTGHYQEPQNIFDSSRQVHGQKPSPILKKADLSSDLKPRWMPHSPSPLPDLKFAQDPTPCDACPIPDLRSPQQPVPHHPSPIRDLRSSQQPVPHHPPPIPDLRSPQQPVPRHPPPIPDLRSPQQPVPHNPSPIPYLRSSQQPVARNPSPIPDLRSPQQPVPHHPSPIPDLRSPQQPVPRHPSPIPDLRPPQQPVPRNPSPIPDLRSPQQPVPCNPSPIQDLRSPQQPVPCNPSPIPDLRPPQQPVPRNPSPIPDLRPPQQPVPRNPSPIPDLRSPQQPVPRNPSPIPDLRPPQQSKDILASTVLKPAEDHPRSYLQNGRKALLDLERALSASPALKPSPSPKLMGLTRLARTPDIYPDSPRPSSCSPTPDRCTLSPSPAIPSRQLSPSPSYSLCSSPSPSLREGTPDSTERAGKSRKPYKIKSTYKALAAIPTNTLLLEQQAIDDEVEKNEASLDPSDNFAWEDPHSQMCTPAQLRQQSADLYAAIDEALEDTNPTLEHPHTVPADGAVGVEVEGHQVFWTCDTKPFILVLTTVPPHTDSLGVSTKTKAGLVTEDDPLPF
ncbi:hypothetical protein NFI96_004044 [Prochilodus magdalenae]|nr:hypothetical protein NFI96_004044 [Prochilodus magdalenae]